MDDLRYGHETLQNSHEMHPKMSHSLLLLSLKKDKGGCRSNCGQTFLPV